MPAFIVTVEAGQLTQAPTSSTTTTPVSSLTSRRKMSPPSACTAGRMTSIVAATCSLTLSLYGRPANLRPVVVAHQGGWDEALIVLAPMLVFFGLLFVANRRARALDEQPQHEPLDSSEPVEER